MKKIKIARVDWIDASYQKGPIYEDEFRRKINLQTVGFLVKDDPEGVSLSMDSWDADESWRHVQHIPRKYIKKVAILKEKGRK